MPHSAMIDPLEIQLGKCIGRGGFGVVHEAMYRGRQVAVKRLLVEGQPSSEELAEFKREIQLMANVR